MIAEKSKNWHLSGPGGILVLFLCIEGIDGKGREFQNASRSLVRLVWFLDFVYEMVKYMRENPNVLDACCVKSVIGIGNTPDSSEIRI